LRVFNLNTCFKIYIFDAINYLLHYKNHESILQIVDTLSATLVDKKEEVKIPDENKKESKTRAKVGLSAGAFIPLSLDEIKNPVALLLSKTK
jgi:hypothetical protein